MVRDQKYREVHEHWWVEHNPPLVEEAADRAYDRTMIAVRPDVQGGGRGAALMRYAEDDLRQRNQRLRIVRTSGTSQYAATRAFYRGSMTRNSRASRTTGLTATTSFFAPSA